MKRILLFVVFLMVQLGFGQVETFTTSGSFTVPCGVTSITVEAWGGGGAGGGAIGDATAAGGGGGGGAYRISVLAVTPGSVIAYTVGAGGTGGTGNGGAGGTTTFSTVSANGGNGGIGGNSNNGTGGTGGTGGTYNGGNGINAALSTYGGGGGSSAGSVSNGNNGSGSTGGIAVTNGGAGGNGGVGGFGIFGIRTGLDGSPGGIPGGGGGGADRGSLLDRSGGDGANGQVRITYLATPGPISGTVAQCPAQTGQLYSITAIPNATSYSWTVPAGWSITAGSTTNTITVTTGTAGQNGNITVRANKSCGTSISGGIQTLAVTVISRPTVTFTVQPGATACSNTNVTYTTQSGQTNYVWVVPGTLGTDYSISSGGIGSTSNTVTLQWLTAGSKTVTINYTGSGGCTATAATSSTATTVTLRPTVTFTAQPGATACSNTNVTYTTQSGQTNYVWVVPGTLGTDYSISSGGIGSTSNTVTLQWLTAGSKTVTVNYTGSGGCTAAAATSSTATTVTLRPTAPTIGTIIHPTCTVATGTFQIIAFDSARTYTFTPAVLSISGTGLVSANPDTYSFTVDNASGCISSATPVIINPSQLKTWTGTTSTDWNVPTNWSPAGIPTTSDCVVVPDVANKPIILTTGVDANANTLQVDANASLTINSLRTLTVVDKITVAGSGTLTFEDQSSLVQDPSSTTNSNSGAITYKRISSPMKNFDYTYWSSPVTGQNIVALSPNTLADKYFRFNGATDDWDFYNGTMVPGVGYIIRVPKPNFWPNPAATTWEQPVAFVGVPNNGDYSFSAGAGEFNLIGNPYPSAIDADSFINTNGIINGALYFWTHNTAITNNEYTADDYASYTLTGGTGTGGVGNFVDANNNGIMDPVEEVVSNRPLGKIAAGQSFFVENSIAGSFQFTNAMRVAGNNSQFFKQANTKKTATVEKNRVWLNLTNSGGAFKQLLVGYLTGATNDWDNLYDGPTFDGQEFVDFYSVNQGKNLTIQGRALPFVDTDVVPLGYRSTIAGPFDISIDNRDGALAGQAIWLEDKKTNTLHELSKGKYTFTAINGVENDRFVLKYTGKTLGTDDNEVADKSLIVSVKNKKITLTSSAEAITQVQLFDLLGRKVYDKSKINAQEWSISNLPSSEQTLIVKTTLANGTISNKKIIY